MPALSLAALVLLLAGCLPAGSPRAAPVPAAAAGSMAAAPVPAAERYRVVSQPDELVSVLENGLTVIARRVASPVLAVRGYVAAGGVHEGRWLGGGLSHLLEHLVAGGTTDRRTEAENRALLQKIGNNANAYTTFDHTAYFINTTPEHLAEAVDLLAGWLFGARITEAEFRREHEVVQRELEQGRGEPDRQFFHLAMLNRYRQSPIRVPVIGYQDVIRGLIRDDVYAYYRLAYQPNNVVIAVAGAHPPETMLEVVRRHAGASAGGREFSRDVPAEPPVLGPRTVVATFPRLGQAILQLAFPTVRLDHPDLYALDLLAAVLAEGESSLLVQEIRDARRLVTAIGASSFTPDFVTGSFEVQLRLDPDQIAAASRAVLDLLARVERDGVAEDRVRRAKTQVRVARIARLQTAEAIAASLATDYLSAGDPHFTDRYVERIQAVTADELRAVARRYLDRERLLTTAMLPAEHVGARGLPRAEDLIRPVAPAAPAPPPAADGDVTRVELDNGTVLLHKRITTSPLVVTAMYALGGLTAEDDTTNGLGNLAMTLAPRGTTGRSAAEIAAFFDSIGGGLTAGIGNNTWSWTMTSLREDFEKGFEVFADVVERPAFPAEELALARQRILAAIDGQDAEWTDQAFRFFRRAYHGPRGSPYRFVTIGTRENVAAFTRDQVVDWYARRVLASPRVLAVFGDVDRARAEALARTRLGALPAGGPSAQRPADAPARPAAPEGPPAIQVAHVEVQKTEQPVAGIVVGFEARSVVGDAANFPLLVADTMASGYAFPAGYLHEVLRGKGLVYVVHAYNAPGRSAEYPGAFVVYAGADPERVDEVVEAILQNVARLQGRGEDVQPEWFDRSKELILTSLAMENETPADQATTAALDELHGLGYAYHETFPDRIKAVSLEDVRRVARLRLAEAVVTVSTPAPERVTVRTGRREYRTFPPVDLTPGGVQHEGGGRRP